MWLPSVAENILVQLAASLANISVVTVKNVEQIDALEELQCKGTVLSLENHLSSGRAAPATAIVPPIVTGTSQVTGDFLRFNELLAAPAMPLAADVPSNTSEHFYGTSRGVSSAALLQGGANAAEALQLQPNDRICLPITPNHIFGFGSGIMAAVHAGAAIVLPSPSPSAEATLQALQDGCTLLYADTHTLEALQEPSFELPGFRGGLVKVGSGDAISVSPPRSFAGKLMKTVGKAPGE